MGDRRRNPDRRRDRRGLRGIVRENWYRDVWLILTTVLVLIALVRAQQSLDRETEGRRVASGVTCSAISAVIDAGRATIQSGAKIDPRKFELALERLGLPPRDVRERHAKTAAQVYARLIAQRVRASGVRGVVRLDGTLDCKRLREVTRVGK